MNGRRWGGIALLALAGLMLIGFMRSSIGIGSFRAIVALLVTVALPAAAGLALLRGFGRGNKARHDQLRQATIDAEVMKLAIQHAGKLTALEVSTALALPPEDAKAHLDAMVERDVADLEITDDGMLVYTFTEARHIGGKSTAKGILDA